MKKIAVLSILVVIGFLFLLNRSSLCDDRMVIIKDYGEMKHKVKKDGDYCFDKKDFVVESNHNGETRSCRIGYLKRLGIYDDGSSKNQSFSIRITSFLDINYAKNEFLIRNIRNSKQKNEK